MCPSNDTVKTFYLQNGHLIEFEAMVCVYCMLPFEKQKAGFFRDSLAT